MSTPVRDAKGRFVAKAKLDDGYKPDPDVWVQFTAAGSYKGCGNRTLHGMNTARGKKSPFATSGTFGYNEGTPAGGIRLTEVIAYLKKHHSGRELDLTFVHYPSHSGIEMPLNNGTVNYTDNFKAWEFMELLDHTPEAKRVNDWFNTNHTPPSHLRSYSIVFHAVEMPKDFLEMKK